jgi:transposase
MVHVGVDLHKKFIVLCVVRQDLSVQTLRRFACQNVEEIVAFFKGLGEFQAAVEATGSYEWFVALIEPLAHRVVLVNAKKYRTIAESCHKTDKIDARNLAKSLAEDKLPLAYRPTPRQREHRSLVRHRQFLQKERTQIRNKVRRIANNYNADRKDLFTAKGQQALAQIALNKSERFIVDQLMFQYNLLNEQIKALTRRTEEFAKEGSEVEQKHREVLRTIPGVGPVTTEAVLSELGGVDRFTSAKGAVAYAGLAPGRRESAGKGRDLGISKSGSGLLRCALVEASWQLVRRSPFWKSTYLKLKARRGARRAIVAIARRLLGVMIALLRSNEAYKEPPPPPPRKLTLKRKGDDSQAA